MPPRQQRKININYIPPHHAHNINREMKTYHLTKQHKDPPTTTSPTLTMWHITNSTGTTHFTNQFTHDDMVPPHQRVGSIVTNTSTYMPSVTRMLAGFSMHTCIHTCIALYCIALH